MSKLPGIFCIIFFLSALDAGPVKRFDLRLINAEGEFRESMEVAEVSNGFEVRYYDRHGKSSINIFDKKNRQVSVSYLTQDGAKFLNLDFNYNKEKIISSGEIEKTYPLEGPVLDGNGAVFFAFSKVLPEENSEFLFNLLQSREKRIVQMNLKFAGKEQVEIAGKKISCLVYETGLVSRVLSFFWPYKYRYWYEEKSRQFVRYQGPIGHKNSEVIEVLNLSQL